MFDALDESIKNLLIDQIPVKKNEINIVFDQPTDDWAAREPGGFDMADLSRDGIFVVCWRVGERSGSAGESC